MQHPGITGHRHDAASLQHQAKLVVGELAPSRHQGAAILMAGEQRTGVAVERLVEGAVGQVGDVQDQPGLLERGQQRPTGRGHAAVGAGAAGVTAQPVVHEAGHAQAGVVPALDVFRRDDRIAALHRQHDAHPLLAAGTPALGVRAHVACGGQQGHLAGFRQRTVPRELAGGRRGRRGRGGVVEQVAVDGGLPYRRARDQRGQAQTHAAGAHLRQGNGGQSAPGVIAEPLLAAVQFRQRQGQVALVAEGIPGEIEVAVDDQRGRLRHVVPPLSGSGR